MAGYLGAPRSGDAIFLRKEKGQRVNKDASIEKNNLTGKPQGHDQTVLMRGGNNDTKPTSTTYC